MILSSSSSAESATISCWFRWFQVHRDSKTRKLLNLVFVWADEGTELKVDVSVVFKGEDAVFTFGINVLMGKTMLANGVANLTWIHTSGTNGISMVLAFLRYDIGRNSHENRELESGYASWNVGHLQQKAEIKLRAKSVLDLVSNVSSMDMLRPKLTKLPLKVTAQRSLGLEPDERLIDLGNKDDEASDQTKFKQLTLEQAIPLDRIDPSQVPNALNEFTQKLSFNRFSQS
ncbi:hypothetical protein Tco_1284954 [Tanacetum coccineum]